jgi:MFS family permease
MTLVMTVFTLGTMLILWLPLGHLSIIALYFFVVLFGFGTGSFVSLSMGCIGQICGEGNFGRWIGAMCSAVSIAYVLAIAWLTMPLVAHFPKDLLADG